MNRTAVGRHEGYDRVVFEFQNALPGYRIEYVQPPLKEDGSGKLVDVQGVGVVVVRMEPASGFDLNTDEGVMTYKGPKRIEGSGAGTSIVQELVRTGDFEAVLSWAIGLSDKVDFRVRTATSPSRLIVDFRNH
ncbi:MAG: AMIN-like domain-containing (lipo)protein [Gaiellaceae bacterium]